MHILSGTMSSPDDSDLKFIEFVRSVSVTRNNNIDAIKKTNTRIGSKEASILGRTLSIPAQEDYKKFLRLYARDILRPGKKEYYTEKQLYDDGPFLIDLDFRYDFGVKTRQHTQDHVESFIADVLEFLKNAYQMDDDTNFQVFVLQKDSVNCVQEKQITKDGIHIIIALKSNRAMQLMLRNEMLQTMGGVFEKLPLTNTMEDVYDDGIAAGHVNWQLFGSTKPQNKPYKLYRIYDITYDSTDGEISMDELDVEMFDTTDPENLYKLSARCGDHPALFLRPTFVQKYEEFKSKITGKAMPSCPRAPVGIAFDGSSRDIIMKIVDDASLKIAEDMFVGSLGDRGVDRNVREVYEYTMALGPEYYESGSYNRWIRVCWALANSLPNVDDVVRHRERLLFVWVRFSANASGFRYTGIPDLIERWDDAISRAQTMDAPLSFRSIMYWVRESNPDKYREIYTSTLDFYVDQVIYGATGGRVIGQDNENVGEDVYAELLYQSYKNEYVCVSVSKNNWFKYCNGRWRRDDAGQSLRKRITDIKRIFMNRINQQQQKARPIVPSEDGDEEQARQRALLKRLVKIVNNLGATKLKENIMKEARCLFYDQDFINKLDTNKDIIAFENGVVDFAAGCFRKGRPDDYLSLSTGINYSELGPSQAKLVSEVDDFIHKLFPESNLREYMWEHLASTLTGHNKRQNAHFYIGVGANGKSALIELMSLVLGEYKADVPSSLIIDRRAKVGGTAPEIVALQGKRLAVIQEPSKDDVLNEGVFKQLTSANDPISGRALYASDPVTFKAQFKLVVATNYLMKINATDNGTWRRIAVVDFKSLFTDHPVTNDPEKPYQYKVDREMTTKFIRWKEVFAAMLVKRAMSTKGDVSECEEVMGRSNEYRSSQDAILEFIRDKIRTTDEPGFKVTKSDLASEFSTWHTATYGRGGPTARDLYDYFSKQFGRPKGTVWRNIRIIYGNDTETDDETDEDIDGDDEVAFLEEESG